MFQTKLFRPLVALTIAAAWNADVSCFADNGPHFKVMGVGSCASSNCHGSVSASASKEILGNEFYTWYKFDKHASSYKTLLSVESKKIAEQLGIGDPSKEKLCLDCHTTNTTLTGERYRAEDGVSCESCHGASEEWLKTHTEAGATHASNLSHGMTDLTDLSNRALLCGSCHFGDSSKEVTHKLYGAGHPRLSFELDTFEAVMPRHWKVDKDYKERKADYTPSGGWSAGQIALATMQLDAIDRHIGASRGIFPEFSLFTCFSCHQSISSKAYLKKPRSSAVGLPHINTTHLELVSILLEAAKNPHRAEWDTQVMALKGTESSNEISNIVARLRSTASEISNQSVSIRGDELLSAIKRYALSHSYIDFQLAEQLVMGVAAANDETHTVAKNKIKELYAIVYQPEGYDPVRISAALRNF